MKTERQELLDAIRQFSAAYPTLRLGQLMITLANWATGEPDKLWDLTDEELLAAITTHLERTEALQVTG
jgi:hypothetical protein